MVIRDLRARYAGSGLGVAWVFVQPVLWMVLYTAVFSVILRVPVEQGFANFPEFLLAGLLPWMAIQEGISRAASALPDNAVMVKKAVFPIEMLVASVVVSAVVNQLIASSPRTCSSSVTSPSGSCSLCPRWPSRSF